MMTWATRCKLRRLETKRRNLIRRGDKQRIAELEAQVTRLQNAYFSALEDVEWLTAYPDWEQVHKDNGLETGDLAPVNGDNDA